MRKSIALAMVVFVVLALTGCDALQRKFTRKKKYKKPVPRVYQLKKYDIKPSAGLYSKHYAYWQSWMSELLQELGDNHKKDLVCINEALNQLNDMQNLLVEEKANAMEKHIKRLEGVREIMMKEGMDQYNKSRILMIVEREDRVIKRDFSVTGIKDYIKASFDETPTPKVAESATEPPQSATFGASLSRDAW